MGDDTFRVTIVEAPTYLHATAEGEHSPQNATRFLKEAYDACVARGHSAVLLEMNLSGPSLDLVSIFGVIMERGTDAAKLRKIAYVDASARDPDKMAFAETVAVNRGINVRLFRNVDEAKRWMSATP